MKLEEFKAEVLRLGNVYDEQGIRKGSYPTSQFFRPQNEWPSQNQWQSPVKDPQFSRNSQHLLTPAQSFSALTGTPTTSPGKPLRETWSQGSSSGVDDGLRQPFLNRDLQYKLSQIRYMEGQLYNPQLMRAMLSHQQRRDQMFSGTQSDSTETGTSPRQPERTLPESYLKQHQYLPQQPCLVPSRPLNARESMAVFLRAGLLPKRTTDWTTQLQPSPTTSSSSSSLPIIDGTLTDRSSEISGSTIHLSKGSQDVFEAPAFESSVRPAKGLGSYQDGSIVVEVRDMQFGAVVLMRQFPSGEMIPIDQ